MIVTRLSHQYTETKLTHSITEPVWLDDADPTPAEVPVVTNPRKRRQDSASVAVAPKVLVTTSVNKGSRKYPCMWTGCGSVFSQKLLMRQHLKAVHLEEPFRCPHCDTTYIYKKSLVHHIHVQHSEKTENTSPHYDDATETEQADDVNVQNVYRCNVCGQTFGKATHLIEHLRGCIPLTSENKQEEEVLKYECSVCEKQFQYEDAYREHFKSKHVDPVEGEIYYCEICIVRLFTPKAFKRHCETAMCKE